MTGKNLLKILIAALLAVLMLAGCTDGGENTTAATDTKPSDSTDTDKMTDTSVNAVTTEEPEAALPDYYIDMRDEKNILACGGLHNVNIEPTADGMRVIFLPSNDKPSDPAYCFDPYMSLPVPDGTFSVDEYPYFVMILRTDKNDLRGDIRYKTDGLENKESYPTYRFDYGEVGEQKILLDLSSSSVLFIAATDAPVTGNYTQLRMDMFENDASTENSFEILCYAFFKTRAEAREFQGLPDSAGDGDESTTVNDMSEFWLGNEFQSPANVFRARKLLYNFSSAYAFELRSLRSYGYGGVTTNVTFNSQYLKDEEEFRRVRSAYEEAFSNNMIGWIYDEYQWPSGKAFGQVLEGHPEYEATGIECIKISGSGNVDYTLPDSYISILGATVVKDGERTELDVGLRSIEAELTGSYTLYVYAHRITNQNPEKPGDFASLRDVDLLNPDAVDRFIELTYQKYKDEMKDTFGKIEAFFTDEPQLGNRDMNNYVVFTKKLPERFEKMHGYSLNGNLYSLFYGNTEADKRIRVNFYQTVSAMFKEAYFDNITQWCEANKVSSSGHMLFEENIQRHIETYGGDYMQLIGAMSIPGGDVLHVEMYNLLSNGTDIGSFMGLKYTQSAAKNNGKTKVMLEFSPLANPNADFAKSPEKHAIGGAAICTFFGANRITVICPDNVFTDDASVPFNEYIGRVGTILDGAYTTSELGVFYPVNSVRANYNASVNHFGYTGGDEAAKINYVTTETCKQLLEAGLDYTMLDEQSIAKGTVSGGKIKIGLGEYSVIVMPRASVIGIEALEKLAEFQEAGGSLIWIDKTPQMTCDNGKDGKFDALLVKLGKYEKYSCGDEKIITSVKGRITIGINVVTSGASSAPAGLYITEYRRDDDDVTVYYIVNTEDKDRKLTISLAEGGDFAVYEPVNGRITAVNSSVEYALQGYEGVLIVVKEK